MRVYVDLLKTDDSGRVLLTPAGTLADISAAGIRLQDGLTLLVYTDGAADDGTPDNLLAEGMVRRDVEHQRWVLELDQASLRHESECRK